MTTLDNDKAFNWVITEISKISKWNNNPFKLPPNFGWNTIAGDYEVRVNNILHYLQDEARVIRIIEEPGKRSDPSDHKNIAEVLFDSEPIEGGWSTYKIEKLENFDQIMKKLDHKERTARLALKGDSLMVEVDNDSHVLTTFRADSKSLKVITYLLNNPNVRHEFSTVRLESDATSLNDTPSEFIRRHLKIKSGVLKDKFFPIRDKKYIQLKNPVLLGVQEYLSLVENPAAE